MIIGLNEYCSDLIMNKQLQIFESYIEEDDIFSEAMEYGCDILIESSDILLEETTNRDMLSEFRKGVSEARKLLIKGNGFFKKGDKAEAKKCYDKSYAILDELEKYLRGINDFKTSSKILGNISGLLISLGMVLITNSKNIIKSFTKYKKYNDKYKSKIDELETGINAIKGENKKLSLIMDDDYDAEDQYDFNNDVIDKANWTLKGIKKQQKELPKEVLQSHLSRSIIPYTLNLVKAIKDIVQVTNGGVDKGYNSLRNKLIGFVVDMKALVKLYRI